MNDIIYVTGGFIGGLITGYVTSSIYSQQCISTPLLDTPIIPIPTKQDYLAIIDFPGNINKSDFLYWAIVNNGTNVYKISFAFKPFEGKLDTSIAIIYPIQQNILNATYNATSASSETELVITSDIGTITTQFSISSTTVSINIPSPSLSINYIHYGAPFKFNNGKVAIITPNRDYVYGMEFPGNVIGTINSNNITGYGIFERLNWNFNEFDLKGYRWIPFSTNDGALKGIVCTVGLYRDGCFWYNNTYYGLDYIDISTQSYKSGTLIKQSQLITATSGQNILLIQLNSFFDEMNIRNYCTSSIYLNGAFIGNGFTWEDSSVL